MRCAKDKITKNTEEYKVCKEANYKGEDKR